MTPLARKFAHHLPHVAAQFHVDAGRGLVEEQYLRLVHQRLGDHHAALHAAGEGHDLDVALVPQRQRLEHALDHGRILGLAEQATTEARRGLHGLEGIGGDFLGHQADQRARGPRVALDVEAAGHHPATGGVDQSAGNADQGGLAGAIGAQQGEDFALLDLEVDRPQCGQAAGIGFGEVLDPQDGLHG